MLKWAYGVTTVPQRRDTTLPRTLRALTRAGFDNPWLFVDGDVGTAPRTTYRSPGITPWANWWLSAHELFMREPTADRFAVFQDDFVCITNLRRFLDRTPYRANAYYNLITHELNVKRGAAGWYQAPQRGMGAVALVFNQETLCKVLSDPQLVRRPLEAHCKSPRNIDGGVFDALERAGCVEMVHSRSLVDHLPGPSTIRGNLPYQPLSTFPGEVDL